MAMNKNDLYGYGLIVALLIVAIAVMSGAPSMSTIATASGFEYQYNYAPFNEDTITVIANTTAVQFDEVTWPLYYESDQHYPLADIEPTKCGQGGAWLDYLNEICYYDIQKDNRIVYVDGLCSVTDGVTIYQATELTFDTDTPRAITCKFPSTMNLSNALSVQYNLVAKLTFAPVCNVTAIDPNTCTNSWLVQPFKQGGYIVRYDSYGCENYLCTTDWQYTNIAIGLLVAIFIFIIVKIRLWGVRK
jgi:hypothetical protein